MLTRYSEHHHHYLTGTPYATLKLPANHSVAACCEQCTAAPHHQCDGWQLWNASGPTSNSTGDAVACALIVNGSLAVNPDRIVSAASPQGDKTCWYSTPAMKAGFAPYCSLKECSCNVANTFAVGREPHAMCYGNTSANASAAPGGALTGLGADVIGDSSVYERWISALACLMDGNWYSTQAPGECKPDGSNKGRCWWRLESSTNGTREVNASCADGRVQAALRSKNEACWDTCGAQADNVTALCPVSCLFKTIMGNTTEGRVPMSKAQVVQPFVNAFAPHAQGGCPSPRGWP